MNKIYNTNEKLKPGVMLEFTIYDPIQKTGKKLTFRLAIIAEENTNYYGYVCAEDNNLHTSSIYSGGQTGVGVDLHDIQKFDDKNAFCKKEFIRFL